MNILILGSGGRGHAFGWKIQQSKLCTNLFIAPGNAGTAQCGTNIDLDLNNFESIQEFCIREKIEIVFVGPEFLLVNGIVDYLLSCPGLHNLNIIGPNKAAARLEGSKSFGKAFMTRNAIPTAKYREFDEQSFIEGVQYIKESSLPIVLKADGLAAGKGVLICKNHVEAMSEFDLMIHNAKFGEAGKKVVVEDFLNGIELSVFILTDGKDYVLFPEAKDYKRISPGDKGLNTGGMGAISPVPFAHEGFMQKVIDKIIEPTLKGLRVDNIEYKGFIFFGLIKVEDEPILIEYNCRMGDPESEAVLLRVNNDVVELFKSIPENRLGKEKMDIDPRCAATIVAVSEGYPNEFETGKAIDFGYLENPETKKTIDADGGVMVFHMGTKMQEEQIVTNGGRVLAVSALADTIGEAVFQAKEILNQIYYDGMYYRNDIGFEFYD